jgi:hypothetical protein
MKNIGRRAFLHRAAGGIAGFHTGELLGVSWTPTSIAPQAPEPLRRIAVSITKLGERARRRGAALPPDVATLGGIRTVDGYVVEPDGEVLLFGRGDTGTPMHIDDLAVSLRNRYARANDPVYSDAPGCTIDPRPNEKDPWALQDARLIGLPPSRMGARMLAYDYELKRIGGGITPHRTIPSTFDLSRARLVTCNDSRGQPAASLVHRYWFVPEYPASPRYAVEDTCLLIEKPVSIRLLTEQEFLKNGERVGSTEATPDARNWADQVTAAMARGTYASDMVNDFRLIEVATLMRHRDVAAPSLAYWLHGHSLEPTAVPKFVGGIHRQEEGELVCESDVTETPTRNGVSVRLEQTRAHYRIEYRGGVEANIRVESRHIATDTSGRIRSLLASLRKARPSPSHAAWNFLA